MDVVRQLFSHGQVLTKECKTFIKHHEKAISQNDQTFASMLHCANNLNANIVPNSHAIVKKYLTQLQARGQVCLQMCDRVLSVETRCQENVADQEKALIDQNNKTIEQQMSSINNEFDKEVKQLQDLYKQMRKSVLPLNVV